MNPSISSVVIMITSHANRIELHKLYTLENDREHRNQHGDTAESI
jgi:hypothetical protein